MASLTELVHDLPPELFNHIQDLVFTATESIVILNDGYKPPVSLQVSKATRRRFAQSFYGSATVFEVKDLVTLCKFLASLTYLHRHYIDRMRLIVVLPTAPTDVRDCRPFPSKSSRSILLETMKCSVTQSTWEMLQEANIRLRSTVTKLTYLPAENTSCDWERRAWCAAEEWCWAADTYFHQFVVQRRDEKAIWLTLNRPHNS